jgi:phage gpG-like protein
MLKGIGVLVVQQIRKRIRENRVTPKTGKAGTTLYQRGKLSRSIKWRIEGDAVVISAGGADVPYARIQHEGGIIRPKHAKFLAIPLTPAAKEHKPREYPGATFIRKGIIFEKLESGKVKALYALKKQVELPARPYMFLDPADETRIREIARSWAEKE